MPITLALHTATPSSSTTRRHPKAYLATDNGLKLVLPFAPREVSHDGLAAAWETVDRDARKPLVVRNADGIRTMSFTVLLGHPDHQTSVDPLIAKLRRIAGGDHRVTVKLSDLERGAWRLIGCSVGTVLRQYGTNAVTRATADLSFIEATTAAKHTGPVTGGHRRKRHRPRSAGSSSTRSGSYYTVRAGDTLARIAGKTLGDPNQWSAIAKANHITHPHSIKVGDRLRIPNVD